MNGKENSLRSLEARLRSLAADMGVDLEAWRGEGMVVLSPAAEPDFHFPPSPFWRRGGASFSPPSSRGRWAGGEGRSGPPCP
uniref:Uncharacterized protein n=1 Tax=Thermus caliditerrae TaxID=1330700 RepID=A0A7C5VGG9_9DEIN